MRDAIREILTLCHRHSSPEHPILAEIVRTMVDKMETEMYLFVQVSDLPTNSRKGINQFHRGITRILNVTLNASKIYRP